MCRNELLEDLILMNALSSTLSEFDSFPEPHQIAKLANFQKWEFAPRRWVNDAPKLAKNAPKFADASSRRAQKLDSSRPPFDPPEVILRLMI